MVVIRSCLLSLCFVPFTLWNIRWYWHCIAWLTFSQKFVIVGDNVPKKNTLSFGLPKLNLTLSIFVASCPNSGQGRGWDLGNAQKKRFFLGRRPLIEIFHEKRLKFSLCQSRNLHEGASAVDCLWRTWRSNIRGFQDFPFTLFEKTAFLRPPDLVNTSLTVLCF